MAKQSAIDADVTSGGGYTHTFPSATCTLGVKNDQLTVYASGTAYVLTTSAALLDFGTTDPSLTINQVGTWLLLGRARIDYNGATFAANQTVTLKLRRTNNTAADVTNSSCSFKTEIITTQSHTAEVVDLPPVLYTTSNTDDIIQVWGSIGTGPSAGSIDASEASIVAIRVWVA